MPKSPVLFENRSGIKHNMAYRLSSYLQFYSNVTYHFLQTSFGLTVPMKTTGRTDAIKPRRMNAKIVDLEDELEMPDGNEDQQEESTNEPLLKAVRYNLAQKPRKPSAQSALFSSRKSTLYSNARKNAKEIVSSSINAMEGVQGMLSELRSQEIALEKYHEDCLSVMTANKDSFNSLATLYQPVWRELGQLRAEKLEGASTMLKNNHSQRYEVLREVSKRTRQQLEQARQQEKDAEDAAKLIEKFKRIVRT